MRLAELPCMRSARALFLLRCCSNRLTNAPARLTSRTTKHPATYSAKSSRPDIPLLSRTLQPWQFFSALPQHRTSQERCCPSTADGLPNNIVACLAALTQGAGPAQHGNRGQRDDQAQPHPLPISQTSQLPFASKESACIHGNQ